MNKPLETFPSLIPPEVPRVKWKSSDRAVPEVSMAVGVGELEERNGIRPIFFEGSDIQGKPTKIFAWRESFGRTVFCESSRKWIAGHLVARDSFLQRLVN